MRRTHRVALTAGLALTALGLAPVTGSASPSEGVTGEVVAQAAVGDKAYILRKITIAPDGTTGWHFHDGMLYGLVTEGTLTHYDSDCAIDGVYSTGGVIVEPSGHDYVHMGRNLGPGPMVLRVLYVLPAGTPMSEDAPAPDCT